MLAASAVEFPYLEEFSSGCKSRVPPSLCQTSTQNLICFSRDCFNILNRFSVIFCQRGVGGPHPVFALLL